jgi:hypothetical protein
MQALTGITSRLDRVQSFLDDKIADTPLADLNDDDAAQRKEAEAAVAARRRLQAAKSADAVKDELLGAVQDDDDDDDDLETDALKAENARLKREVRSLTTDLEAAERDGNNYRNDARDARKKLAALKRAQDDEDDSTKQAEASLKRDLADAQAGAAKASEIAKAARAAELKLQTALDDERRKTANLTEELGDARDSLLDAQSRAARADADAGAARREAELRDEVASLAAALAAAKAEPAAPVDRDDEAKRRRQDDRYAEMTRRVAELESEAAAAAALQRDQADELRRNNAAARERRQRETANAESEKRDLEESLEAMQRERDSLQAKLREADATIAAQQQRSQQPQLPPPQNARDGALAAQLVRKQALLDAATADRDGLRSSLSAQRRANESLRVELDEARRSRADDPRGLRRRLKLHRAPNTGLGGAVDTVDQWMAAALRLLNSSPLFRLVFFAWVVLHHAYVFMVFFYHHLPHIGGSAPPRLRGGGRAAVDALG